MCKTMLLFSSLIWHLLIPLSNALTPSEFEDTVAQVFFDLENGNQELKSDLKDLYINTAIQMNVVGRKEGCVVVIHVSYHLRKELLKGNFDLTEALRLHEQLEAVEHVWL